MAPDRAGEGDGVIRAFFAVELGEGARRAASEVARALALAPGGDGVRWVRPEGMHVTLRFLGNIDPERIPSLVGRVGEETAALDSFRLELGAVRAFPSPRRPRVVALELAPEAPLVELAGAVERGVVAAGFEPEARSFRAHLTLGRVKGRFALPQRAAPERSPGEGRRTVTAPVTAEGEAFEVTEAVLFRSQLHRSGARYTAIERVPLGVLEGRGPNHP